MRPQCHLKMRPQCQKNSYIYFMNNQPLLIKKASGEMQPFSAEKLRQSLKRSGAENTVIDYIIKDIESWIYDGVTSKEIYTRAYALLRSRKTSGSYSSSSGGVLAGIAEGDKTIRGAALGVAARYKLKNAIMELGPTGHPFEHFVGKVYQALGYDVEVAVILQGQCVTHEVDVLATSKKLLSNPDISNQKSTQITQQINQQSTQQSTEQIFIECKYYQSLGKTANVQVPLYIHSRVEDIIKERQGKFEYTGFTFSGGIVTNTRFTDDATTYGECSGLHLLGWDYPIGNGLKDIIDKHKLYPISSLSQLTSLVKHQLMDMNIVICKQIQEKPDVLDHLIFDVAKRQRVLAEVAHLCG